MRLILLGLTLILGACASNPLSDSPRSPAAENAYQAKCDYSTDGPGSRPNMRVGGEEYKNFIATYENCLAHVYEFMKANNRDTATIRFVDSRGWLVETKITAH